MNVPKIVFCSKGHVFDSSIDESCPYCYKRKLPFSEIKIEDKPGKTESIDEEPTELLRQKQKDSSGDRTEEDDNDATVLLRRHFTEGKRKVIGWFVGKSGADYGKSKELYEGVNCVSFSRELIITDNKNCTKNNWEFSVSYRDQTYSISEGYTQKKILINGRTLKGTVHLSGYEEIRVGQMEYVFVPLVGYYFNWENG